jgi:hypothetical protein
METYSQEGHDFILLQVPALNKTLVYDTATSVWHDRQTGSGKHFSSFMITKGGVTYVGSAIEASIGILDPERGNDSGVKLKRQMITPVDTYAGRINSVELVLQYFNPPSPAKLSIDMTKAEKMLGGEWPIIAMAYTDDDGRSWSVDDSYELEPNPEMRPIWNKLGYANRRSYRFTLDADISCIWAGAWLT